MSQQEDLVEKVGDHLRYIYSQHKAFSDAISDLKDRLEGLVKANEELRGKVESVTAELVSLASSFEARLAQEMERLEKDLEVLSTMAAKDSELKEFKARMEAEVSSLKEVALLRSEFEEFVKKFAQKVEERLPPIPPPEEKPQEGQA